MAETLWSDGELRIALIAYLTQQAAVEAGGLHSPTAFHKRVSTELLPGRSEGAIARRMSNISWVLSSSGRPHFTRYAPTLTQAGNGVKARVLAIYDQLIDAPQLHDALFEVTVAALMNGPVLTPPAGQKMPASTSVSVMRYARSAAVAAWVLQNAKGVCEACDEPAPFIRSSGTPYLEIHHLHRLADGGPDTIENTVAVCPNCHRRLHLGADAEPLAQTVRLKIARPQLV